MLKSDLVELRAWNENDVPLLTSIRNNVSLQIQLMTQPKPNSRQRVISWLNEKSNANDIVFFVIADVKTDAAMGFIQFTNMDILNGSVELGVCLDNQYQGKGFFKEALLLSEPYIRNVYNIRKIVLKVLSDNVRATDIYKKNEFTYCGTLRKHFLKNGEYVDVGIMEKIIREI